MKKNIFLLSVFLVIIILIATGTSYAKYVIDRSVLVAKLSIDRTPPIGTVSYSDKADDSSEILVTIHFSEPINSIEGWEISEDNTTINRYYKTNIKENIKITDLSGNESLIEIQV